MKRFFCLLLILICMCSFYLSLTNNVYATTSLINTTFEKDEINYQIIDENSVKVIPKKFTKSCKSKISIPETVSYDSKDYNVVIIGDSAFEGRGLITDIVLPESIKSIERSAFFSCCGLQNINIPNNVNNIDDFAFYDCSSLKEINIPSTTKSIGNYVFNLCTLMEKINVSLENEYYKDDNGVLINKKDNSIVYYPSNGNKEYTVPEYIEKIGNSAFAYSKLEKIVLPENICNIDTYAFFNCKNLKDINLLNAIKYIGKYAFYKCSALKCISIPDNVTSVNTGLFLDCVSIEDIGLPANMDYIGINVFNNCTNLKTIKLCEYNKNYCVENDVLYNKDKTLLICCPAQKTGSFIIPDTVIKIYDFAFNGVSKLDNITMGDNVEVIGKYAFSNCSVIDNLNLPNSVKIIDVGAFTNCPNLSSVTIPLNVSNINRWAFDGCENLKKVVVLNKDVNFEGNKVFPKLSDLIIYGVEGSTAEKYCAKNSITFSKI